MKTDIYTKNIIAVESFNFLKNTNSPVTMKLLGDHISKEFNITDIDKNDKYPSGDNKYLNMIRFGLFFFKKAGLVRNIRRGKYILTEKGRNMDKLSVEDYTKIRREVSKKNNKEKRAENVNLVQGGLFGKKKKIGHLTNEDLELLKKVVEQNNKIVEKIINN